MSSDQAATDRKTVLYEEHKKCGGKLVPFGGWEMPVSYTTVLDEHKAVREDAGIFDVSHMGELWVSGKNAADFLQQLTINDVSKLKVGGGQYSAMCRHDGGMVDDLILYQTGDQEFLMCINASNTSKDFLWVTEQTSGWSELTVENQSSQWSQLAVQGPACFEALDTVLGKDQHEQLSELPYTNIQKIQLFGKDAWIARTGYTGEKGYELYIPNEVAVNCWQTILETKDRTNIKPIGLGARDTLRLEACYLLYGNDMNDSVTPLEAGIGWATKIQAKDFIGKDKLVEQKSEGVPRRIYAFKFEDKGIPRQGMKVYRNDELLGLVTSGSVLPTVGGAGGMALLATGKVIVDDEIQVDVRGKRKLARITKRPLYSAKAKD